MNQDIRTVIYPVNDIAKAKALFRELLGVEPYTDAPDYVGFQVGDQDIGLDPNGHKEGMTAYCHVSEPGSHLTATIASRWTAPFETR